MKRIFTIAIGIMLMTLMVGTAMARPAAPAERVHQRLSTEAGVPAGTPVDFQGSREDTLFLFAASGPGSFGSAGTDDRGYTFDFNGAPVTAGWTSVDKTAQEGDYWHLADAHIVDGLTTDMSSAGEPWSGGDATNDWAIWCGREDVCGWASPSGYGNNWNQYMVVESSDFADSLNVNFAYNADFEGDTWDFFQIFVDVTVGGNTTMEEFYRNTVGAEGIYQDMMLTVFASDFDPGASFGDLTFRFSSDGAWSDEDGLQSSDEGAVWIDNLQIINDDTVVFQDDFESGVVPAGITFTSPPGAGDYSQLYQNLFSEDICQVNVTSAWAFFDLNTTNPEYPIPVTPYGPPYFDTDIRSPLLESAHVAGDPTGAPLDITAETQVWLDYWIYYDLPQNALVYQSNAIAAQTAGVPCVGVFKNDNTVYFGDDKQWIASTWNLTQYVAESAQGGTVTGLVVALNTVDMCPFWCNTQGDGTGHTPAPYFDNVRIKLIGASAVAWDVSVFDRFQDNFPEVGGKVRIDSCNDVGPIAGSTVVIGDSTMIELNMDLVGGIQTHFNSAAGETRPDLRLWFRVTEGPHAGTIDAMMADQDGSDGIFSPYDGTQMFDGETWGTMVADSASTQDNIVQGKYAFDFNDDYFEPGDVIELFYRAEAGNGEISTRPGYAMATDPELRSYYTMRCLPTSGATTLFCDDANGTYFWWYEAFRYNGYSLYDTYLTQAPSSGLENGLSGRAEIGDLAQYDVVIWDSGGVPTGTVATPANGAKTDDAALLTTYLEDSTHDTYLWMMGDLIAVDLTNGNGFLSQVIGGSVLSTTQFYDDYTGVLVPKVFATHPALEVGGLEPYIWVDGGCPSIENFSVVEPAGLLASEAMAWEQDGGTNMVAGILNLDPDGDGEATSPNGWNNHVLFNPFSYVRVRDAGFGVPGFDYARRMVGDVLSNLFAYQPNTTPDGAGEVPASTQLAGNFPNPFNPKTTIRFSLSSAETVHLNVYDISGRTVKTLVNGPMIADHHEVVWDGKDEGGNQVASGVYFYKLVAGDYSSTEKMVLLK